MRCAYCAPCLLQKLARITPIGEGDSIVKYICTQMRLAAAASVVMAGLTGAAHAEEGKGQDESWLCSTVGLFCGDSKTEEAAGKADQGSANAEKDSTASDAVDAAGEAAEDAAGAAGAAADAATDAAGDAAGAAADAAGDAADAAVDAAGDAADAATDAAGDAAGAAGDAATDATQ